MSTITMVEVSPRDGLQNEATLVSWEDKVRLIELAVAAGSRRIEATAFVHPQRVPQMADAETVMARVPRGHGVTYSGLVLNRQGFARAHASGVDEVNMVVVCTDTFGMRNQGMTTEQALDEWFAVAASARAAGIRTTITLAAAFGCPFEGEVPPQRVQELARRAAPVADEVALADTIGVGVPTQVTDLVARVRSVTDGQALRCHFHNTRNTGYSNAVAAIAGGVEVLDSSLGGIGGCPFAPQATGNVATEDLIYTLDRMGIATGLDLDRAIEAATWLSHVLGEPPAGLLARAGNWP